jgi:hypothetical protein
MQLISSAVASSLSDGVDAPLEAELEPPVSEIAKEHSETSPSGVDVAEVIDVSDDLDQPETWPSIAVVEETSLPVKDGVKDDQPASVELIEEEDAWPSIHQSPVEMPVLPPSEDVVELDQESITELQSTKPDVADVSDDEQMDESAWPSIATVEEINRPSSQEADDLPQEHKTTTSLNSSSDKLRDESDMEVVNAVLQDHEDASSLDDVSDVSSEYGSMIPGLTADVAKPAKTDHENPTEDDYFSSLEPNGLGELRFNDEA